MSSPPLKFPVDLKFFSVCLINTRLPLQSSFRSLLYHSGQDNTALMAPPNFSYDLMEVQSFETESEIEPSHLFQAREGNRQPPLG